MNSVNSSENATVESTANKMDIARCLISNKKRKIEEVADPVTQQHPLPLKNRFSPLQDDSEMDAKDAENETDEDDNEVQPTTSNETKKIPTPPPIVLHSKINDHKYFTQVLNTNIKKGYHLKFTKEKTNIYIKDMDEYKHYITKLEKENVEFHTYTTKDRKTHAFVVWGLDSNPEIEELEEEIKIQVNTNAIKVYRMKATRRPAYLVSTPNTIKLSYLSSKVRYLLNTKIKWERHYNSKLIIQCHRCQEWGHATTNCRAAPVCLKCADGHWTKECKKSDNQPAKCANCNGDHPANSVTCKVYISKINEIQQNQAEAPPKAKEFSLRSSDFPQLKKFVPSPPPKENPWQKQIPATSSQPPIMKTTVAATVPTVTTPTNNSSEFSELINEFNTLNSLININNMIRAVRDLNGMLQQCSNTLEKFQTFNNFAATIDKYGI